jgi:sulfatase modifying factor 1
MTGATEEETTMRSLRATWKDTAWPFILSFIWAVGIFLIPSSEALAQEGRLVNSLGMTFVLISPGTFLMGSAPGGIYDTVEKIYWKEHWIKPLYRDSDEVQHEVVLTKPFYMQVTELTQGQWKAVMGSNPSYFKDCGEDCPVERISWIDAQEFIQELNKKNEGKYRLPTEAEWEYCARAGTATAFSWGNQVDCSLAMFQNNTLRGWDFCVRQVKYRGLKEDSPAPVKSYPPNPWGLYDMHGNIWEWCQDWYGPYPEEKVVDPKGAIKGSDRVRRGGSWFGMGTLCRSANRTRSHPAVRYRTQGFRVVREYP